MTRYERAKERVIDRLDELVPELFPNRVQRAGAWHVVSPGSGSRHPDQMVIWRGGGARGAWKDFIAGEKGDAIDLIAYAVYGGKGEAERRQAVEWIEGRFGLRLMDKETLEAADRAARERRERRERDDASRLARARDSARKMFHAAEPTILGTLAETYLKSRGIDFAGLSNIVWASFRFQPKAQFWTAPKDKKGNKPLFPALITKMVDAEGHGRACHLTFLEPDGSQKLDTRTRGLCDESGQALKAKLMWPGVTGLCVRLSDGETGLTPEKAAAAGRPGVLATCEGIEDGFSIALARPHLRVWPAGSLPNLLHLPLHDCASAFLVFKDNDWGKPQAEALFERAHGRIRASGKPTEIVAMPAAWGKDVNDAINFKEGNDDGTDI